MWNEFDNSGRSLRSHTPINDTLNQESSASFVPMVIDDYYDNKQEGHDNRDNRYICDEKAESSTAATYLMMIVYLFFFVLFFYIKKMICAPT
jgi:hypothetical protein